MLPVTKGLVQKLLATFLAISPHSMTTEQSISHYNQIKSLHRMRTSQETINDRLFIALNARGTAFFDPRRAVGEFLNAKERRYREPDSLNYESRPYCQKFFKH